MVRERLLWNSAIIATFCGIAALPHLQGEPGDGVASPGILPLCFTAGIGVAAIYGFGSLSWDWDLYAALMVLGISCAATKATGPGALLWIEASALLAALRGLINLEGLLVHQGSPPAQAIAAGIQQAALTMAALQPLAISIVVWHWRSPKTRSLGATIVAIIAAASFGVLVY